MAHRPERPQEYVCDSCLAVYVGAVDGDPPDHTYVPPEECSACGGTDFVEIENYPHEHH